MPQVEGRGKQRLKTRLHHLTRSIKLVRRDPTDLALPYTEFSTNFVFSFLSLSLLSSEAHGRITGSHRIRDPVPEAGQRGTRAALWHVGRQFYKCRKESVRLLFPVFGKLHLLLLVDLLDGGASVCLIGEGHKAEATGPASLSVAHHDLFFFVSISCSFFWKVYIPHRQLHQWWKRRLAESLHWCPRRGSFPSKIRKNIIY